MEPAERTAGASEAAERRYLTIAFSDLGLSNLNVAVGLSVEYTTPIGVVRGGMGVRVNRLEGDVPDPGQRFAYHITIGEAF